MGIERQSFVGNPHKTDYTEDDILDYSSGDEMETNLLNLPDGDPDLTLHDNYDIITDDDDDEDYDYIPEDDYEDFLSDCDGEYQSDSELESGSEGSSEETDNNQECTNKSNEDNKTVENKLNSEPKGNGTTTVAAADADANQSDINT